MDGRRRYTTRIVLRNLVVMCILGVAGWVSLAGADLLPRLLAQESPVEPAEDASRRLRFLPPTAAQTDGSASGLLPFVILKSIDEPSPVGPIAFGLMRYQTPEGETCWAVAAEHRPEFLSHNASGFCNLGPARGIQVSLGQQIIEARGDGESFVTSLPFTTLGGSASGDVNLVKIIIDGSTHYVAPSGGGFLFVTPGLHPGPATVVGLGALGTPVAKAEVMGTTLLFDTNADSDESANDGSHAH